MTRQLPAVAPRAADAWPRTTSLARRNGRKRAAALAAGQPVYQHEVTEFWPACAECGTAIHRFVDVGRPGLWRRCSCTGVVWNQASGEWVRHTLPLSPALP